jgi:phage tail sheath protein FI
MVAYQAPGVYRQDVFAPAEPSLMTGVPAFLGYATRGTVNVPQRLMLWPQFEAEFGSAPADGYLDYAVRGFFENDGLVCYVVRLEDAATPLEGLRNGLTALTELDGVDLVCAPDIMRSVSLVDEPDPGAVTGLQSDLLTHCRLAGNRFAILDGLPTSDSSIVERQRNALAGDDGALYYPWLWAPGRAAQPVHMPPCGHLAGAYSRSDRQVGPHKAPANEPIEGALDLRVNLTEAAVGALYTRGVNCLRALPGRGVRVWGARTLSDDPAWASVNARRVFLTITRWLDRIMANVVHEPNDIRLWVRIMREITGYLEDLFERGALNGRTPDEAFFVKCDSETNPLEVRATGSVVTLVGLAISAPAEFVVARIIHGPSGVTIRPDSAIV